MATNYGLCIVIALLSVVTVMVRGAAVGGIGSREGRGGEFGSGERGELGECICFYCDKYQLLLDSLDAAGNLRRWPV